MDSFSYGVVLWEIITKERSQRGNWRPVRVPEECPAEVEALLQVRSSVDPELGLSIMMSRGAAVAVADWHHVRALSVTF